MRPATKLIARFVQNNKDILLADLNTSTWYWSEIYDPEDKSILAHANYSTEEDAENFLVLAKAPEMLELLKRYRSAFAFFSAGGNKLRTEMTITVDELSKMTLQVVKLIHEAEALKHRFDIGAPHG